LSSFEFDLWISLRTDDVDSCEKKDENDLGVGRAAFSSATADVSVVFVIISSFS
jgi:hypothetical protein